ncbi:hypothetical protein [Pseudoalteromonas sp. JC3]|uniref:hypothetical protein n=1 Tax=Pseudoalteromonas sp. JC3 TaxID=2810196 RepID=UPI0019CF83BB|nr:hypothetical protein [Pseudoalteromonas sp. JC3]MBR8842405.1 hypothetical protein [Pseudoalteromonas sp. JC3]WJE09475.1 hypothetical protein QSH61_03095 [Pseudoalteromonas sp. JC3]
MLVQRTLTLFCLLIIALTVAGCSTPTPYKVTSQYDSITLHYQKQQSNEDLPTLISEDNKRWYGREIGPHRYKYTLNKPVTGECFKLVPQDDHNGKPIHKCIKNPLPTKYAKLLSEKDELEQKIANYRQQYPSNIQSLTRALNNNPAYKDKRCLLPATESLPERPHTICDDKEALQRARISCLAPLGSKACQYALKEERKRKGKRASQTELFLAGNACSSMISQRISGGEIGLGLVESAADAIGDGQGGFFDGLSALLESAAMATRIASAYSCFDGLVPNCVKKIRRWESQISATLQRPYDLQNECNDTAKRLKKSQKEFARIQRNIEEMRKQLNKNQKYRNKLMADSITLIIDEKVTF